METKTFFAVLVALFFLSVSSAFAEEVWKKEILDLAGFSEQYTIKACSVRVYRDGRGIKVGIRIPTFKKAIFIDVWKEWWYVKKVEVEPEYKPWVDACNAALKYLPEEVQKTYLPAPIRAEYERDKGIKAFEQSLREADLVIVGTSSGYNPKEEKPSGIKVDIIKVLKGELKATQIEAHSLYGLFCGYKEVRSNLDNQIFIMILRNTSKKREENASSSTEVCFVKISPVISNEEEDIMKQQNSLVETIWSIRTQLVKSNEVSIAGKIMTIGDIEEVINIMQSKERKTQLPVGKAEAK